MYYYIPEPKHIKDDFYAVEETGWLPVNRKGEFIDTDGNITKGILPANGVYCYYQYNTVFRTKAGVLRNGKGFVHKAVALTFLEFKKPFPMGKLEVNHIDGNKLNNCVENLEWVTHAENIEHAIYTGLLNIEVPVEARNYHTGEYKKFRSISECSKFLNISGGLLSIYIKRRVPNFLLSGAWDVKKLDQPWKKVELNNLKGVSGCRHIYGYAIRKGLKNIVFVRANDVARHFNISAGLVTHYLKKPELAIEKIGYSLRYIDQHKFKVESENPDNLVIGDPIRKREWNKKTMTKGEVKLIYTLDNNREEICPSLADAARRLGASRDTLLKYSLKGQEYMGVKIELLYDISNLKLNSVNRVIREENEKKSIGAGKTPLIAGTSQNIVAATFS